MSWRRGRPYIVPAIVGTYPLCRYLGRYSVLTTYSVPTLACLVDDRSTFVPWSMPRLAVDLWPLFSVAQHPLKAGSTPNNAQGQKGKEDEKIRDDIFEQRKKVHTPHGRTMSRPMS